MNKTQIAQADEVLIVYTGCKAAPITFPGQATGKNYQFSKNSRIQVVKEPDVPGLIGIGVFERAK